MATTYPYGYGSQRVTEAQLKQKTTFSRLHPEMQRRFIALMRHMKKKGVDLGVGTGWRVQPTNKPGFAAPGNSWHEGVPVSSKANALAIDTVPASSWNAMEVELSKFGLRSFRHVNNEPWHIQLYEIPASRRWATTLPTIRNFPLPGVGPGVEPTPVQPTTPEQSLYEGDSGQRVVHLQNIMNFWGWGNVGNADGQFGPRTKAAVVEMQKVLKVEADGQYGPTTRWWLQIFLNNMAKLAAG